MDRGQEVDRGQGIDIVRKLWETKLKTDFLMTICEDIRLNASAFLTLRDKVSDEVFILRNECNVTVAKGQYDEKYKDNHLYDCGLVVNPEFSVLGATADGKLCSNGTTEILEIKTRMLLETSELKRQLSQLNGVNEDFVVPSLQRNIIEATSFRSRIVNQLRSTYSTISEDEDVYSCDYEDIREVSNDSGFLKPEPITSLSPASDVIKKCYSSLSKD
ncbi:unnamed protein product [Mytilus edulis]|uniref:YqaJ viral recombinase domain-containing protein n=1 Tax=Mytilus edulis TaxID=6550 RepID=A0A8S3SNL0_MYTED|nr:unnamed protein product [Mytilus edulis]